MQQKINIKCLWIEEFTVIQLFILLVKSIFSKFIIHYDEHTASFNAVKLLNLLKKIQLGTNFYPAGLSMTIDNSQGYALTQEKLHNLDTCINDFCRHYLLDVPLRIKKMTKPYLASILHRHLTFITMVEAKIELQKYAKDYIHVLCLSRHPFNIVINKFLKKNGMIIKEVGLKDSIMFYLKPGFYLAAILFSKLVPTKGSTNIKKIRPAVWVEYNYAGFVDFAFWQNYVKTDNFEIVSYLDRSDDGLLFQATAKIENRGFKWIDLHFFSLLKLIKLQPSDFKKLFRSLCVSRVHLPLCFKFFQFEYNLWLRLYELIFRKFKVRILIQHQESFWRQAVQAEAIELAGGIMLGYNWSNYHCFPAIPTHFFPQHVYFVWGKRIYECLAKTEISAKYILPSGLWILKNIKKPKELNVLRQGLSFILAVFDGTFAYNLHNSPDAFAQFYLGVLGLIESNKNWGGIIKSKNYDYSKFLLLPKGATIVAKIEALRKEGRILLLDRHNNNPLSASAYADLSVCYGLNSAGIISGIHGSRAIHWDCAGVFYKDFYFYKDPTQQIIYLSLEEFKNAIIRASKGDKNIGDFSRWRQEFNYFDDFLAPQRVGNFIQSFMDEVLNTNDAERSLDYSVTKYIRENNIKAGIREELLCI